MKSICPKCKKGTLESLKTAKGIPLHNIKVCLKCSELFKIEYKVINEIIKLIHKKVR